MDRSRPGRRAGSACAPLSVPPGYPVSPVAGSPPTSPGVLSGLTAFARPYISGEIKRHFRDKRWPVHVPRPVQELVLEIRAESGQLAQDLGRVPAESDFARYLGVSGDVLREARRAEMAFQPGSLDAPLGGEPDTATLADQLGGEDPRLEHILSMRAIAAHRGDLTRIGSGSPLAGCLPPSFSSVSARSPPGPLYPYC